MFKKTMFAMLLILIGIGLGMGTKETFEFNTLSRIPFAIGMILMLADIIPIAWGKK